MASLALSRVAAGALLVVGGRQDAALARTVPQQRTETVRFAAAPGPLDNPLKGWCTYADAGPIRQPYSMVYRYVSWKELEPQEGRYAFDAWEKRTWDGDPLARGKRIVFRVYLDYPHLPSGIPDWLLAKGIATRRYSDYGGGVSPDYDDPRLVSALERLIAAMGARYDTNPRVAFVPLGLLGFWGEWHTFPHSDWFASAATQKRIVDAFHRAFPHKILQARYPGGATGSEDWIGYHDDMFPSDSDGPEGWEFLPTMRRSGRTENWKRAAIGGEMVPGAAQKWLGPDYRTTLSEVDAMHMTWVGPYSPAIDPHQGAAFTRNGQEMVRRMGYEYRLIRLTSPAAVRAGDRLRLHLDAANDGVAPFYYPWEVDIALLRRDGSVAQRCRLPVDIRQWMPGPFGVDAEVPIKAPSGDYRLAFGIIDPWTGKPAVRFANALPCIDGWTVLRAIRVR